MNETQQSQRIMPAILRHGGTGGNRLNAKRRALASTPWAMDAHDSEETHAPF